MAEDRAHSRIFGALAGELVASGLGFRFQAKGRSMLPTIEDGEILHVCPADWNSLRVADIVLFRDGAEFKAHRVIRRKIDVLITRGDSAVGSGVAIRREQIVGKIVAKESAQMGLTIRLEGLGAHLRFFTSEMRTWLSRKFRWSS